tara:strand:+ start:97 stop:705 length:609 start_codon:yes stop_codon:yes gene_type:complete
MIIHQLFPEPLYFSSLERVLTQEELKIFNEHKKKTRKNDGNTTSSDSYVLEHKVLKNLKKDLHTKVMDYFDKVVCTNNITPYITQSWINYTESDQFHLMHFHPNSLVSGIFYVSADKKVDTVTFRKSYLDDKIKLNATKYNIFNSSTCTYPVETGNILFFRSSLGHGVDKKKGNNIRISLSFNIFIKGTIGDSKALTELILE